MSDALDFQTPTSRHDIAADYVLGTLSAASRRAVDERLAHDTALRQAVQRWQEQLLPLTALAPPVEPTAQLWQRIQASADLRAEPPLPQAATARPPATLAPNGLHRWWGSLQLWRGLAGTGFAAAAVLAAVLVTRMGAVPNPQYLVVLVAPQDKAPGWVVQASNPNGHQQLSLIPLGDVGAAGVPVEKTLQFWTKGADWKGPVSLGLVTPGQTLKIPLDALPPLQPNQLFELTLEPSGGSSTGKPTGPIQFIGRAVKVT
jgi:anti-sigma-K factor RskA